MCGNEKNNASIHLDVWEGLNQTTDEYRSDTITLTGNAMQKVHNSIIVVLSNFGPPCIEIDWLGRM